MEPTEPNYRIITDTLEPRGILQADKLKNVFEFETDPVKRIINSNAEKDLKKDNIVIDPLVIKNLELAINNPRWKRREIARKTKTRWTLYKKLEMLVTYRIQKGLNVSTGEMI